MDRLEMPDQHDRRIAAVLVELAELGRRIGERAGELAELARHRAERRRPAAPLPGRPAGRERGVAAGRAALTPPVIVRRSRAGSRSVSRARVAPLRRRFAGPLVTSAIAHAMALVALSAVFVTVESRKAPVALTFSEGAEASFEEEGLAEFDAPAGPEEPQRTEEPTEPAAIDASIEALLAADATPLEAAIAPPPFAPEVFDEALAAGEGASATPAPPEGDGLPGGIGAGELAETDGGERRGARGGKPAATFFGRAGQGRSVCFICDNSSSYRDGRFHAVLDELVRAVEGLRAEQSFFVIFSSDAAYPLFHPEPVVGLQPATPANKRRLRAWLGTVEMCRGGQGILDAARLAATLDADCVYLLSDGELTEGTIGRLAAADFGGAAVHTFGVQGTVVDPRTGRPDAGRLFRQEARNRNLFSIATAHGGTFTPVTVPAAAAALERLRPIPRNRSRGAVWGVKL